MRSLKLIALSIALGGTLACGGENPCKPDGKMLDTGEPQGSGGTGYNPGAGGADAGPASGGITAEGSETGGSGSGGRSNTSIEGGAQGGSTAEEGGRQATGGAASGGLPEEASGGATTPPVKPLPGDVVFEEGRVLEFRMTLSDADWRHLEEHGDDEEYLPASATIRADGLAEAKFTSVGLRHKGAYSLERCFDNPEGVREDSAECRKLSYKIKFDEYVSESRLDGLKRINLHASATDPTKLRELLAYDTYRAFGVDAPRARPAKLYINDQLQGLFIAVEEVDGRYTKAHYPEGADGNVYKEIWPHPDQTKENYQAALETNEDEGDVSDMLDFSQAIGHTTARTFEEDMSAWVDLEEMLRYVAVDRALKNWDGVMAFYGPTRPHNIYWYHEDRSGGLFHLIPWDMDLTFWEFDPYMHPDDSLTSDPIPDWNMKPQHCSPRSVWQLEGTLKVTPPRCDKFLDLLAETQWSRFVELGRELLAGPFALADMQARIAKWREELEPIVAEDPVMSYSGWQNAVRDFPDTLRRNARDFSAFLDQGLVDEPPPLPEPSTEQLEATTEDAGVLLSAVTNYEFAAAPKTGVPAGVGLFLDETSSASAKWNTLAPLHGAADLRLDFTFRRVPGPWNEWIDMHLDSSEVVDASEYTRVVMKLAADRTRNVRVRVLSPAFEEEFGGAWAEFGVDITVSTEKRSYPIRIKTLPYAAWAKENWKEGQGWTGSDEDVRAAVLRRCSGLMLSPLSTTEADGELREESETGFLQIDDIYFQ